MDRIFFILGAASAGIGVAAGAIGAHLLKGRLEPEMLGVFDVAVRYQVIHAFALIVTAWAWSRWPGRSVRLAGWLFAAGAILFSGSLYLLSLTGIQWLGAITPAGGACFLLGWLAVAWGARRRSV